MPLEAARGGFIRRERRGSFVLFRRVHSRLALRPRFRELLVVRYREYKAQAELGMPLFRTLQLAPASEVGRRRSKGCTS